MSVLDSLRRDLACLAQGSVDRRPAVLAATNRGFHALVLYRVSRWLWQRHVPVIPDLLSRMAQHLFAIDISYEADLGPGIVILHGFGVVIGRLVRIEGECWLYQGVALGHRGSHWVGSDKTDGQPVVERGVVFGAGAKILGPIRIGAGTVVGANAVVLEDMPPDSVVAGVPARRRASPRTTDMNEGGGAMRVLLVSHSCMSRNEGYPKLQHIASYPDIELTALVPDRMCFYGSWIDADPSDDPSFTYVVGRVRAQWIRRQWYLMFYPWALYRLIREVKPDVVDVWHEPWSVVSAQAVWLTRRLVPSARIIVETEANICRSFPAPFRQIQRYVLRRTDAVLARSRTRLPVSYAKKVSEVRSG